MATPPPTNNAAPAAPAASAPAPAAAPAAEQRHPAHASLMERLMAQVDDEPEGSGAAAAPAAAPAAGTAEPAKNKDPKEKDPKAAETPPPAAEPGIRARKAPAPTRPELPLAKATPAAPLAAAPAPAAVPQQTDEEFEAGLVEGEKELLDQARFAEKSNAAKFKGLTGKVKNFIKEHGKFLEEHPDIDEKDPLYTKFLSENRPKLSAADVREIETARVAEAARKPVDERVNQLQHEIFVRDETPKIENFGQETFRSLAQTALPANIAALIKEKGGLTPEIAEEFSEELETAHSIFSLVSDDLKEFRRFSTKNAATGKALVEFDDKNEQHIRLAQLVGDLCDTFKNTGGAQLQRNGKWFVTRDEWAQLDPARRGEFWTFTNAELEKRALAIVPSTVAKTIEHKAAEMTRRGYVKKPRAAAPAAAVVDTPPPATGSPALRPSAVPPAAVNPKPGADAQTTSLAGRLMASD